MMDTLDETVIDVEETAAMWRELAALAEAESTSTLSDGGTS